MSTAGTSAGRFASASELVDYTKTLDCIHCGLCLRSCPTYQLTGAEASSPRGRIHLMRAVAEDRLSPDAAFADEMEFCLLCRHCESVCPAGVRFGALMEHARGHMSAAVPRTLRSRFARWLGFRVVLPHRSALRAIALALRLAQRTGLVRLAAGVLGPLGAGLRDLPQVPPARDRRPLPERTPASGDRRGAVGDRRGAVALLEGCVMPELYGRVNRATVAALSGLGLDVLVPRGQFCCGSLHAHNGDLWAAKELLRANIAAFEAAVDADGRPAAIVVNSAGCGSHLKECHELFAPDDPWRARAEAFAVRVRDFSEVAAPLAAGRTPAAVGSGALAAGSRVAWDDPCHLCHGQQVRKPPRALLDALAKSAGATRVELVDSESCCGSAGIYSLLRPAASRALIDAKVSTLLASGAGTLVTANPGCQLQWEAALRRAGAGVRVVHLAELVAGGYCADA